MTISPNDLVRREVFYCVSSLVSTLAMRQSDGDLGELCEQALELSAPLADYESAAMEEGWKEITDDGCTYYQRPNPHGNDPTKEADSWEHACAYDDLEPHEREVFEHWIVSDWLADKLEAKGEKVDKDFAGMTIWARTTTGQGIACDWVIEQITADVNAA